MKGTLCLHSGMVLLPSLPYTTMVMTASYRYHHHHTWRMHADDVHGTCIQADDVHGY